MKICILVGHGKSNLGGYDPGAVNGDYQEFQIAREIAKAAAKRLSTVYRVDCEILNDDGKYNLPERIAKFQNNTYDFLAEIHLNAGRSTASGTEVYYFPGDSTGQAYAAGISGAVSTALGIPNRGAKSSDYYGIIRETVPTAVLVETCFISSGDLDKVKTASGQTAAGNAIADGIAKTVGLQSSANGWIKIGQDWYYYENGQPVKSAWRLIDGKWYALGTDGKMLDGLQTIQGKQYYFYEKSEGGRSHGEMAQTNEKGELV